MVEETRARIAELRRREAQTGGGASETRELLAEALAEAEAALEALRESEALRERTGRDWEADRRRYAELFELTPDAYFLTDRNGMVREVNHAASLLLNVPEFFLVGKPLLNFVALEYRSRVRRELAGLNHGGPGVRASGSIRMVPRRAAPFPASVKLTGVCGGPSEGLTAVRWIVRDLTDHTRAEAERYRLVVDAVPDYAIFIMDEDGRVENWNRGAEQLLGYTEDEAVGMDSALLFLPEDRRRGEPAREAETARATGGSRDERWHVRKDGSRFFASGVLVPLRGFGLQGFVKILRDITDRRRMEETLEEARGELEQRMTERTAELAATNAALQSEVAERRAAEAARRDLMRRLVTAQEEERRRISRELHDQTGQYLTALSLGLRALADSYPPATAARPLLAQLHQITDELGREVHRLAVELRPTALDDLGLAVALRGYVEEWSARTHIAVDLHAPDLERHRMSGNLETTLYRIVQEALNNVLKHAHARHVSILIDRRPDEVLLIVEDDGRGFDVDQTFRATQPGPGDAPPARRHLGLVGMRERVSLVGGSFTAESTPGRGTTLFVLIPTPYTSLPGRPAREENGRTQ